MQACLIAKIHNVNCIEKSDLKPPSYFNPMLGNLGSSGDVKSKIKDFGEILTRKDGEVD